MDFVLERIHKEGSNEELERVILKHGQPYTCGRGRENDITCLSMVVSRKHCIFFHSNDGLYVQDQQSSNGIFINGNKQESLQMVKLHENDIIGIGCAEFDPKHTDNILYVYKVGIIKSPLHEEAEDSILSKTLLINNDSLKRTAPSTSAGHNLEERCSSSSMNCDMSVPCKIPKYNDNNFHNSRISYSKEIKSPNRDNQSSENNDTKNSNNKITNATEIKSEIDMEIDDDIEIIHMSFSKETKTKLNEDSDCKSMKHSDNCKLDFNYNAHQCSTKLLKECKKVKMDIDNDTENTEDDNSNRSANKAHDTKKASTSLDKPNDTRHSVCFTKDSNLVYTKDQIIKLEDELQITDDEEAHVASTSNKMDCESTPIKLKKKKYEPKTRFSEVDIVDLSDNEDDLFPYSQLFDIKFENNTEKEVQIKQECVDNDDQNNEKIGLLNVDDEIIILTDDENEDNPWLERLSRSQLLNEDKESEQEAIVKDEIDLGIWENNENIMQSEVSELHDNKETFSVSHTSEDNEYKNNKTVDLLAVKAIDSMVRDINCSKQINLERIDGKQKTDKEDKECMTTHKTGQHMQLDKRMKESDNLTIEPVDLTNKSDKQAKEIDNLTKKSDDPLTETDKLTREPDMNLTKEPNNLTKEPDVLTKVSDDQVGGSKDVSIESLKSKSVTRCFVTTPKRLIPIIEAQSLPVRRRNRIDHSKEKQKEVQKQIEEKSESTLTLKQKTLKLKEKPSDNVYDKHRKRRKEAHKSTDPCSSHDRKFITKEEKQMIHEKRKAKLKEIAEEEKKLTAESKKTIKRRIAKPRAKISLKNRGDFLIPEGEIVASTSHKSTEIPSKSNDNQSEDSAAKKAKTLKDSLSSDIKTQKSLQKKHLSNNTVTNITTFLEQSLHLNNIMSTVQITEENTIQEPKTIENIGKKSSKGKKKLEITSDRGTKTYELRDKSTEHVSSIVVQKENFSPNRKNAEKSKLLYNQEKNSSASTQNKKVTFSENVEIRYYEIEAHNSLKRLVGKDAPIPTNKLAKAKTTTCAQWQCPQLEEFLLRIFMWNPVWLEEQRYFKCMPPIVSSNELQQMKLSYDSYKQYYMVAMPLLLHEIWFTMNKDFDDVEKNMQRVTAMCFIVENSITHTPIPSTNLFLMTLKIEVLVEKGDLNKQTHPIYGDLVSFEYVKNAQGKQSFIKVFAYVINMHQIVITDFTHYNKNLKNYVQNPYAVVTYTLLTRLLEHDIAINRVQRVRTISYLRASIRMVQALQYLPQSPLLNMILHPNIEDYRLPSMNEVFIASSSKVTEDNLNSKQMEAVYRVSQTVLNREAKLCFIQGPPGTGKSKVIVNLVSRILYGEQNKKSLRILVCAPSNAATDEVVLRLLDVRSSFKPKRFNMVRIGRPESMHPKVKSISVTDLAKRYVQRTASQASNEEEIMDLQTQINSYQNILASSHKINETKKKEIEKKLADKSLKYEILKLFDGKTWDEINAKVRAKVQRLSEDVILRGADVITCTLSSCYTNQMESIFGGHKERISVCIVDEATQSCEAETLIPLMLGVNTLVLVGDPNQLPATILSQEAKKLGLDQSIFSRMQKVFTSQPNNPIIMLDTQYRMDYSISYWPNKYFYDGKLKNAAQTRTLFPFYSYRVLNHNSAQNDDKFSNTTEAKFISNIIFAMLACARWDNLGENGNISIGVLAPYNIQRTLILNKINEKISPLPESLKKKISFEVNTVDGFQGQERDVIIMSCVRSRGIGFLSDKQRLCVALTRAKQSLIICGNFNTFMKDQMWKALLDDAKNRGVLCNVDAHARPAQIEQFIVK